MCAHPHTRSFLVFFKICQYLHIQMLAGQIIVLLYHTVRDETRSTFLRCVPIQRMLPSCLFCRDEIGPLEFCFFTFYQVARINRIQQFYSTTTSRLVDFFGQTLWALGRIAYRRRLLGWELAVCRLFVSPALNNLLNHDEWRDYY
jgi:hypothetical protein